MVDPDIAHADELERFLVQGGNLVRVATSREQAVLACNQLRPELALLGLALPDVDSIDLGRELLEAGVKFMVGMTAFTSSEQARRALQSGFTSLLVYPVDRADVARMVAAIARV